MDAGADFDLPNPSSLEEEEAEEKNIYPLVTLISSYYSE